MLVTDPDAKYDAIAGLTDVKRLVRTNIVILPMRPRTPRIAL
jgi:hypothetical protein